MQVRTTTKQKFFSTLNRIALQRDSEIKKALKVVPFLIIVVAFYYFGIFDKQYPNLVFALGTISIVLMYFSIIRGNLSKDLFLSIRKQELRVLFFLAINTVLLVMVMVTELEFDYKNLGLNVLFIAMKAVFTIGILLGYLINLSKQQELVED